MAAHGSSRPTQLSEYVQSSPSTKMCSPQKSRHRRRSKEIPCHSGLVLEASVDGHWGRTTSRLRIGRPRSLHRQDRALSLERYLSEHMPTQLPYANATRE